MSDAVNFAGNDYLGLAADPRVVDALIDAARRHGVSATSSRSTLGWTEPHQRLEESLADFMQTPDAVIFGSTYIAGPAVYAAFKQMLGRPVVLLDEIAHTTHQLGVTANGLEAIRYRHLDAGDLAKKLETVADRAKLVATDGVFSISGELAPLGRIAAVAAEHDAPLLVDDAHGFGVLGKAGRGATEFFGLSPEGLTVIASLSKALGCNGGFIVGSDELVELARRSPHANASAIPPPAVAAAACTSLELVRSDPALRRRLESNASAMKASLAQAGVSVADGRHAIHAMQFADDAEAIEMSHRFEQAGLRIPHTRYPSEPRHNMLRAAARSIYTPEQLERFAAVLAGRAEPRSR